MSTTPPPQPAPGYWTPNAAPRLGTQPGQHVNYMAWTGLIVSVSGFIFNFGVNGVVGVVFSILGLREARRLAEAGQSQTGRQLAIAGLITGLAHIVVTIGLVILSIFAFVWFNDWVNNLVSNVQYSNLRSSLGTAF